MPEVLAYVGIFLGCFSRALLPFLKKLKKYSESETPEKWKWRYMWSPLVSLVLAAITATLVIPAFPIPDGIIIPLAFTVGWTSTDIFNTMIS